MYGDCQMMGRGGGGVRTLTGQSEEIRAEILALVWQVTVVLFGVSPVLPFPQRGNEILCYANPKIQLI